MKSKTLPAILAIAMLVVGFWIGRTTQVPGQESAGTIGAASRVQTEQITAYDVEIDQPELQEILQSDEFERMVEDGVFQELFAHPELAELWAHPTFTQALANTDVVLALANPELTELMARNKDYLSLMARPRISAAFGTWMTDREVRQTIDSAIRIRDDGDDMTLTLALQGHPGLKDALARPIVQQMLVRPDFRVLIADVRFREALAKPAFVKAFASPEARMVMASPQFTKNLSSPRLRRSLSYVALSTYVTDTAVRQRFVDPGTP